MFNYGRANAILMDLRHGLPTIQFAEQEVGGLSKPGKMPWYSYSIPASRCNTGSYLRTVEGSVCSKCYACKGRYVMSQAERAMSRRYEIVAGDMARWAAHMAYLLERKSRGEVKYFRWHDSGDVQTQSHLEAIVWIASMVPHVRFWLPTKERAMVTSVLNMKLLRSAPNLTVRLSANMIGEISLANMPTSSVNSSVGHKCPAKRQDNQCGDCRACWEQHVSNVDYPLH